MNKETLSSIVRAVAISAGSGFVTKGVMTGDELETLVSAAVVIISAAWTGWTIWQRNRNREAK